MPLMQLTYPKVAHLKQGALQPQVCFVELCPNQKACTREWAGRCTAKRGLFIQSERCVTLSNRVDRQFVCKKTEMEISSFFSLREASKDNQLYFSRITSER